MLLIPSYNISRNTFYYGLITTFLTICSCFNCMIEDNYEDEIHVLLLTKNADDYRDIWESDLPDRYRVSATEYWEIEGKVSARDFLEDVDNELVNGGQPDIVFMGTEIREGPTDEFYSEVESDYDAIPAFFSVKERVDKDVPVYPKGFEEPEEHIKDVIGRNVNQLLEQSLELAEQGSEVDMNIFEEVPGIESLGEDIYPIVLEDGFNSNECEGAV